MDVSALKAEIKSWERGFKQQHGRDPTIQEIKDLPDIADKYKLYKKLSKQPQAAQPDRLPTTSRSSSSALLSTSKSKPRAVKTEPSASSSNPFSPVKVRHGKQREASPDATTLPISSLLSSVSRTNPFTTPTKPKTRETRRAPVPTIRELDEDPFPLIDPPVQVKSSQSSSSSHTESRPAASFFTDATEHPPAAIAAAKDKDAVSRARKRLRGELVSPSPVKEKRLRVSERMSIQAALTFNEADSSDEDSSRKRGMDTFIDDTPAKPKVGKKQFKVLFDEALLPASQTLPTHTRSRDTGMTRTKSANGKGLFGFGFSAKESSAGVQSRSKSRGRSHSPSHSDDNMEGDLSNRTSSLKLKAPEFSPSSGKLATNPKTIKNGYKIPKAVIPGKDDLWAIKDVAKPSTKRPASPIHPASLDTQPSASQSSPKAGPSALPLLPPSPPPADEYSQPKYAPKGKGKAPMRKKSKVADEAEDDSEEDSDEEEVKVKEAPWRWERHNSRTRPELIPGQNQQADSEPEFDLGTYWPSVHSDPLANDGDEERFEVDLPENLRRVLALSPPPHVAPDPGQEEKLVHRLLYGRREGHYEATRGGEIWGVGEVSGESGDEDVLGLGKERVKSREEDEDEWEGEPVPWEVGEL